MAKAIFTTLDPVIQRRLGGQVGEGGGDGADGGFEVGEAGAGRPPRR